ALAVDPDVAVVDELARGEDRRDELRPVDDRIEPAFQEADQVLGGIARTADGLVVDILELPLGDVGVVALELLLGAELNAEIGRLALASLAVLAGAILAAVYRALGPAPDVLAEAAVDLVLRRCALGHRYP